jgi:2-C-methyl-D-erythritol 4-phosphate cytidylyltransferase
VSSKALIIPAAGAGSRMDKETPKPYLQLSGRTILEHTIRRFLPLKDLKQIVVATSETFLDNTRQIFNSLPEGITKKCVIGGKERQHSINNALSEIVDVDLVIVHDAVRPFIKLKHIEDCCRTASEFGGAVLGVPAKDTIKRIDDKQIIRETPFRKYLWQTQTPQVFRKALILKAYSRAMDEGFIGTDDSSLVERLGQKVKMVEGDRSNFKITYPLDLELAKLLIKKEQE